MAYVSELGNALRESDAITLVEEMVEKGYKFVLSSGGVRVSSPDGQMADFRTGKYKVFRGALDAAVAWCKR